MAKEALLFGLIAVIPVATLAAVAATMQSPAMTIIVTFTDGAVAQWSGCTGYTNDGRVVHFDGTNEHGVKVTMDINWNSVRSVQIQ